MKITKSKLVQIIKEEVERTMEEIYSAGSTDPATLPPGTKIASRDVEHFSKSIRRDALSEEEGD